MAAKPCRFFVLGICRRGDDCTYSHDPESAPPAPASRPKLPCHHFARGRCKRGKTCTFSHDADSRDPPSLSGGRSDGDGSFQAEEALKKWKFAIPKDKRRARPLGDAELSVFFKNGLKLVEQDTNLMQTVVTSLAGELGLCRVRELLERPWDDIQDAKLTQVWDSLLLPYLTMLADVTIQQSTVVNVKYTTLLNDLYGAGGKQAVPVFRAAVRYLSVAIEGKRPDLVICIAVFAHMLEKNDSAVVNPELKAAAESVMALLDASPFGRSTERHIRTIAVKLELSSAIPTASAQSAQKNPDAIVPTFTIAQDMPGDLSAYGPRHDNDSTDIRDISILPTMEEIQSSRLEYLPRENPEDWHKPGIAGLIDRHFRLVREDTVGQLRDAAKFELERLQDPNGSALPGKHQGARTYAYHNVQLQDVVFDENKGLLFVLSFDQPAALVNKSKGYREAWWQDSMRLTFDSLICFLSSRGQATFLVVYAPSGAHWKDKKKGTKPIHELHTLAHDEHRAHIIAQLTTSNPEDAADFVKACTQVSTTPVRNSLIEFPGVVLPAFGPTLSALQGMAETLDIPFQDMLVPNNIKEVPPPPAYSRGPEFKFDLSSLAPDFEGANAVEDVEAILEHSTLDEAQRKAVQHSLSSSLALIQGPPGTGKSYTGIKLIKTLIDNKSKAKLGPVVCVCFTNHALDQLLEHLVDAGVEQVIRIGSRSKSERLAKINLREVSMRAKYTKLEYDERNKAQKSMSATEKQINHLLSQLGAMTLQRGVVIMAYLNDHYPHIYKQFAEDVVDDEGFQEVRRHNAQDPILQWLQGGPQLHHTAFRPLDVLRSGNISMHLLARGERELLFNSWTATVLTEIYNELQVQLEAYNEDKATLDLTRGDKDLRTLLGANVIGITTSGLARNLHYLRKLPSKVLVVEEAGEVLEAHLLTAMLPSLEHAVLIGDHQQLRPRIQNYELSVENPRSNIALDVSLFERLVHPRGENAQGLPYVTLETQRRMHPSISALVRQTLYPNLQNAQNVHNYPEVTGMRHRLFWLDHDKKEDGKNEHLHSTSHTNSFEVDMVAALVRHLQRQGVYAANDIAVLTPYLGQLRKLRRKLASFFDIILNDRDVDDLVMDGGNESEAEGDAHDESARRPSVVKGTLLDALRLATVDNFQGEEAKVVIISLVRSNDQRKCGFLRTPNRINVLLSRAQHGMYIIGNAATSSHVDMWKDVVAIFREQEIIGDTLELACPRHLDTPLQVVEPKDFDTVSPEAGCDLLCGKQLPCGHACPTKCHSESLHNAIFCMKDCNRPKKGCEHVCKLACGADCPNQCEEIVNCDIQLPCGHRVTALPCWQYQDQSTIKCHVSVRREVPGCGHSTTVFCHIDVSGPGFQCDQPCAAILDDCHHPCQQRCCRCRTKDSEGTTIKIEHPDCKTICDKKFTTCEHSCKSQCHKGGDCPPCQEPCGVFCAHSKCSKLCSEPCTPCTEEICPSHCPHSACDMPCGAPCNWVPCSKRCDKVLSCGHQCPSLCGEQCPDEKFCQICAAPNIRDTMVDMIMGHTYADLDLDDMPCMFLPCGHIFTFESLDGQMGMVAHYEMDETKDPQVPVSAKRELEPLSQELLKTCPLCRSSLRSINRYGRVVRRRLLDESTKKFMAWSNKKCFDLSTELQTQQAKLLETRKDAAITGNIKLDGKGSFSIVFNAAEGGRFRSVAKLRRDIIFFKSRVGKEEQPFQRVHDLVEGVRRRQREDTTNAEVIPAFNYNEETILQTRGHLLISALLIRCELIMITDLMAVWENMPAKNRSRISVIVDLAKNRAQCENLVETASKTKNVLQRAEGNIFWAQFVALECSAMYGHTEDVERSERLSSLKEQALEHLDRAEKICEEFPGSTAIVVDEISGVRQMLLESISASEIRMVVAAMSTEFSGTGHWYRCLNGHLFTVGECGLPMESTRCPQCGARIGGQNHQAAEGVTLADDVERGIAGLRI